MSIFTGGPGTHVANATTGAFTGFTSGTVAELQDGDGDTFSGLQSGDTIVAGKGGDILIFPVIFEQIPDPSLLDGRAGSDTLNIIFDGSTAGLNLPPRPCFPLKN